MIVGILEVDKLFHVAFAFKVARKTLVDDNEGRNEIKTGVNIPAAADNASEAVKNALIEEAATVAHKILLFPDALLFAEGLRIGLIEEDDFVEGIAVVVGGRIDEFKGGAECDTRFTTGSAADFKSDASADKAIACRLNELVFEAGIFKNTVENRLSASDVVRVSEAGSEIDFRGTPEHKTGFTLDKLFNEIDLFSCRLVIQTGSDLPVLTSAVVEVVKADSAGDILKDILPPKSAKLGENKICRLDRQKKSLLHQI